MAVKCQDQFLDGHVPWLLCGWQMFLLEHAVSFQLSLSSENHQWIFSAYLGLGRWGLQPNQSCPDPLLPSHLP